MPERGANFAFRPAGIRMEAGGYLETTTLRRRGRSFSRDNRHFTQRQQERKRTNVISH